MKFSEDFYMDVVSKKKFGMTSISRGGDGWPHLGKYQLWDEIGNI